jgi:hypothetical protein
LDDVLGVPKLLDFTDCQTVPDLYVFLVVNGILLFSLDDIFSELEYFFLTDGQSSIYLLRLPVNMAAKVKLCSCEQSEFLSRFKVISSSVFHGAFDEIVSRLGMGRLSPVLEEAGDTGDSDVIQSLYVNIQIRASIYK